MFLDQVDQNYVDQYYFLSWEICEDSQENLLVCQSPRHLKIVLQLCTPAKTEHLTW